MQLTLMLWPIFRYCNAIVLSATLSLVDRYLQVEFQQVGGEEVNRGFGVVEVGDM